MSPGLGDVLFAHRGLILAAPGLVVALSGSPSAAGFFGALPFLASGLLLRFWAVAHIGPSSRTNKTEAPTLLIRSGPYKWLRHPLYCANYSVSLGFLLWLRPPTPLAAGLGLATLVFYWLLSKRETVITSETPFGATRRLTTLQVMRCERSTWLSWTALVLVSLFPV